MSNKYQIAKTFRDGNTWYVQGQVVDLDKADELLAARCIVPLVEISPKNEKKHVETADKKNVGAETRDTKQKGGF
ncbi:MAG: hypothetical protein LBC59_09405 [Chitinispirillales bacterium]|jgi:hypothetical protein|nr:hypothetical protein [Chitinispirillales bacterium]